MNRHKLEQLAAALARGETSPEEFIAQFDGPGIADVGEAQVDLDRHRRCGFPEVVFAQGKTVEAMEKIYHALL
ncbi:MAG: 1-(5-phosphoribosyl)-5-amino-4-imidazole-carboxylate carboxylase, partial [Candidatus Nealsonbacteria bacterium]|nr:1-(5-phosphoribosyl)-5-amino-4-imidazole-carboxylate carboxylase [Candidatus Nealsonbacteria bacterium]